MICTNFGLPHFWRRLHRELSLDLAHRGLMVVREFDDEPIEYKHKLINNQHLTFFTFFLLIAHLLGLEGFLVQPAIISIQTEKKLVTLVSSKTAHNNFPKIHTILTCSGAQRTLATKTKPMSKIATVNPLENIFHSFFLYQIITWALVEVDWEWI